MKRETIRSSEAVEILLSNSNIGNMLQIKPEYMNREITIDEAEEFLKDFHRNCLILFNVMNGE